jgi:type II secretion system (T2SS) protein E
MAAEQTSARIEREWCAHLDDRADLVFPLRDYFRRLGVEAYVQGPTRLALRSDATADELELYVGDWSTRNGVGVVLEPVREEPALLVPPPSSQDQPPRLGELLVRKGFITEEQLAFALTEARASNELLGIVLLRQELIYEEELARTLSEQLSVPYISVGRVGVNAYTARLLPAAVGNEVAAIPVRTRGDAVQVAFADPTDPKALAAVRKHLPTIDVAVAELTDIRSAWRRVAQMPRHQRS